LDIPNFDDVVSGSCVPLAVRKNLATQALSDCAHQFERQMTGA